MDLFEEKLAIVTGGGSGIGEAISRELARRGVREVVADIDADDARRVATAITESGGRATARHVDVSQEQDISRLVEDTAAVYGRLDYQFNNAGVAIGGDARDLTLDHWRRVLDVDLNGVLYGTLAAYPIMAGQGSGHIVNTSSAAGLLPTPLNAPYCTAKHAVVGLSLSLRGRHARTGHPRAADRPAKLAGFVVRWVSVTDSAHELLGDPGSPEPRMISQVGLR